MSSDEGEPSSHLVIEDNYSQIDSDFDLAIAREKKAKAKEFNFSQIDSDFD